MKKAVNRQSSNLKSEIDKFNSWKKLCREDNLMVVSTDKTEKKQAGFHQ